jgi:hypothetical protein
MPSLHISKVAVGCASVEALQLRQQSRLRDGIVPITTRFRPKRAEELIGGSVFWIIKHRLAVRQRILGFAEQESERRIVIELDPQLVPVRALPRRAHQGWRYLAVADAPPDLDRYGDGADALPARLAEELAVLALI